MSFYKPNGLAARLLILWTGALAFLLFGYDQGVCGGIVELPQFLETFNHPSPTMLGFMVAAYNIGCFSGAIAAFFAGDKLGRKKALAAGCVILIVGATLQTSAFTQTQWIVGRIVAGLGTGSISSTVPVWISECTEAHLRGPFVVMEVAIIILGIVISSWTNYGFIFEAPRLVGHAIQWRGPIGLQMAFPILAFLTLPFCPESPRWLALKGRYDEVPAIIAQLRGVPQSDEGVVTLASDVVKVAKHERELKSDWKELFQMGELQNLRRLIICCAAGFFQQATGINAVIYYSPVIFANIGITGRNGYLLSAGNNLCFLLGIILPIFYIERLGRRKVMIYGLSSVGTCMLGVAISVALGQNYPEYVKSAGYAGVTFLFLYVLFFGMSWCSVCWLYASEISSLRLRNKGSALQSVFNWTTCFLTVMTTPVGLASIKWGFYLVWAAVTLLGVPIVYFCFPETSGRSLEQMDAYFAKYQRWNIARVAYDWVELDSSAPEDGAKGFDAGVKEGTEYQEA